ncbi:MAG TPA: HAD family phosphatase [Candidatus Angelobacter sp.]|nr:HAD family phosphatase [Candidatus Angelobacter sp.]
MLAGVIFDFDGVIAESHPVHLLAWRMFLETVGKSLSDEDLSFVLEGAKREDILQRFLGELTPEQIKLYGAAKEQLFQTHAGAMKLIAGIAEFLDQLDAAGMPYAVASSGSRKRVEGSLEKFDLKPRFRSVVTGDDVSNGKPDPALFLLAAERLSVAPQNLMVCEDAVAGVQAAKKAGMKCLAIATNGREGKLKDAGADLIARDFTTVKLVDVQKLFARSRVHTAAVTR